MVGCETPDETERRFGGCAVDQYGRRPTLNRGPGGQRHIFFGKQIGIRARGQCQPGFDTGSSRPPPPPRSLRRRGGKSRTIGCRIRRRRVRRPTHDALLSRHPVTSRVGSSPLEGRCCRRRDGRRGRTPVLFSPLFEREIPTEHPGYDVSCGTCSPCERSRRRRRSRDGSRRS